ncbi:hypothetical protein EMIHUDRAFT_96880 [Emiliania huxleyi CCMP1516]|uniref:Ribosome biogenesis protein NSA2 homolog n=2 Tax=Emiliania huxleyi TaxID=2903 RepID=A0A0D3IEG0_EMIH1|nr:hypothetical protein EMIHUDRAFT_96880 [Emiliania huxleyi CCMP1516]EOD09645.1 hypothetical protein EMIHUDRAFT_96880 [Emiliania huxleyi CCMP1516]|eukprot:XP_005762074.1 hypothetical protein EMIHUDRAFT_96880 [Emiliania huxleyi CCMP1516]
MAQGDYIELHQKRQGKRFDHAERERKKEARSGHKQSAIAKKVRGIKAKQLNKKRYAEKAEMKKTIKAHEERLNKHKAAEAPADKDAVPAYLLDREGMSHAKVLSNSIKQKRKEKAGKWAVAPVSEDEVFKVIKSGKRKKKQWKRMVSFVGESFTRKPPKFERFVRPAALRFKKAHVTHPELKATFQLDLIGARRVKKNPQSPLYTSLGVITKGTIIEVNCADLGLVTPSGKVVWGKYAQVTNNPENDGCINAVLLV